MRRSVNKEWCVPRLISSNGDSDVEQSFRNVLVKRDWTSFATYAHYVRGLFVDPRHVRVAVVDEVLRSPYIKLPLLPNLEALALRYPETLDAYGRPSFSETTLANIAFARLFLSDRVYGAFMFRFFYRRQAGF